MNGLPKNFDPSFFIGQTLEMVCFNVNQVYLHFDNQTMITIEADFSYQAAGLPVMLHPPVQTTDLMQLIGQAVSKATAELTGMLMLTFDNGHIIQCFDSSKQYESYRIQRGQSVTVV